MDVFEKKRAHLPSFFIFVAVSLILILSIFIYDYIYWSLSVVIIFLLFLYFLNKKIVINVLVFLVGIFISLLVFNLAFVRPTTNTEAYYLIWLFAACFLLFTYADDKFIRNTFYCIVGVFIVLAIWGLVQYTTGYGVLFNAGGRANAIFVTPNTFAASINSVLLPLITLYLLAKNSRYLLPAILILFAVLLVTKSRGGWVSFSCCFIFIFILIKFLSVKLNKSKLKKLATGLIVIFVVYSIVDLIEYDRMKDDLYISKDLNQLLRTGDMVSGMSHRFQLFEIAWQQIKEAPLLGSGFHTYRYYQLRDQQAPHIGNATRFAHNDYLQLWMELGALGIILFVLCFVIPVYLLLKYRKHFSDRDIAIVLAIIASLSGLYIHALVDFIFYVPFLSFMIASCLGYYNQVMGNYSKGLVLSLPVQYMRFNVMKLVIGICLIYMTFQPATAQQTYNIARIKIGQLKVEEGFKYLHWARILAPQEPEYYWYEGAVLMNAVKTVQHKPSAKRADALFRKGIEISPFETKNRLALAELHREYAYLLNNHENVMTIISWIEEALAWNPNNAVIRTEYLKTLLAKREYNKVQILLEEYVLQVPKQKVAFEENKIYEQLETSKF